MYKVGDRVLLEGIIKENKDADGEYKVDVPGICEWGYAADCDILGKVGEFERIVTPLKVGDVLQRADLKCVIIKEVPYGFNVLFGDGSSGFRTQASLEENYERTGINIADNIEVVLSTLKGA